MALFKKLIFRHLNQALHKPRLHFSVLLSLSFSLHSFVFFPHPSSFCDHEEAAVFHIQLHNCVCVCVSVSALTHARKWHGQKEDESRKAMDKHLLFSLTNFHLPLFTLSVFWCLSHPFLSLRVSLPLRPLHSFLHRHIQSYWAVKCEKLQHAWQFIILSNFPGPAPSHGQTQRDKNGSEKET